MIYIAMTEHHICSGRHSVLVQSKYMSTRNIILSEAVSYAYSSAF